MSLDICVRASVWYDHVVTAWFATPWTFTLCAPRSRGSSWTIAHATSTPKNSHANCDAHWVAAYAIHRENGTEPSREPVPHLRGRSQ
ncbi:hypothetical protein ABZ771_12520 [Streptomyces globisporus]|uniref:hypothetical protein n=1 Tax=Streptomyces globisporus TaxID=1908 RepID=UPI0034600C48